MQKRSKQLTQLVHHAIFIGLVIIFCGILGCNPKTKLYETQKSEDMVMIPGASFWMGCSPNDNECIDYEKPRHQVKLDEFYMDTYEVTDDQYVKCVGAGVCSNPNTDNEYCTWEKPGYGNHPVNCLDWNQAKSYCEWVGKRLPTEAEWEYATRGGLEGNKYPNGDVRPCNDVNYCDSNCVHNWKNQSCNDGYRGTPPVGSYTANGYGLFDMAGNVWEWCSDWYKHDYYTTRPMRNPKGMSDFLVALRDYAERLKNRDMQTQVTNNRVIRGGSWEVESELLRVSYRNDMLPTKRDSGLGFRCAR